MFDVTILTHGPVVTKLVEVITEFGEDSYYATFCFDVEVCRTCSLEVAHMLHRETFERLVRNSCSMSDVMEILGSR